MTSKVIRFVGVLCLAMAAQHSANGQTGFRIVEFDDGFDAYRYAYVRADTEPVTEVSPRGVSFGRDPLLVIACVDTAVEVLYRFDEELSGVEGELQVQYRISDQRPSSVEAWALVSDPTLDPAQWTGILEDQLLAENLDEERAHLEWFIHRAKAVRIPDPLIEELEDADRVAIRVTDPIHGERFTDLFQLQGFSDAYREIREGCED